MIRRDPTGARLLVQTTLAVGLCLCVAVPAVHAQAADAPRVKQIFTAYCSKCHSGDAAEAGFEILVDESLFAKRSRRVVPGNPDGSKVITRLTGRGSVMPPTSEKARPTPGDITVVKEWIAAGAPSFNVAAGVPPPDLPGGPPPGIPGVKIAGGTAAGAGGTAGPAPANPGVGGASAGPKPELPGQALGSEYVLRSILNDVRRLDAQTRPHVRYFSIAHLVGLTNTNEAALEQQRAALAKAINHLHWKEALVSPRPVDELQTVFRIDLRDVGWNRDVLRPAGGNTAPLNVWDLVLLEYPFGMIQTGSAGYDALVREYLAVANPARPVPYVRADWFVSKATQPPLYHELLFLPRTLEKFEGGLKVDAAAQLRAGGVSRAGMIESRVSHSPRVVERLTYPNGYYWKSYDFDSGAGNGNIASDPINLKPTGAELIIQLPNKLQAYLIFNGKGNRVDVAPNTIVADDHAPDKIVRNGLSCMRCHDKGMQTFVDVIRPMMEKVPERNRARQRVLGLYPRKEVMDKIVAEDGEQFRGALTRLLGKPPAAEPIEAVANPYLFEKVTAEVAANELGLTETKGLERLRRGGLLQFSSGGKLPRDAWESVYADAAGELGLGTVLVPLDGATRPDYEPVQPPFAFGVTPSKTALHPGEDLQLFVQADKDVFVEVVRTSNGKKTILLSGARLTANTKFQVPATPLKVSDKPGQEQYTILVSDVAFPAGEVMNGFGVPNRVLRRLPVRERNGRFEAQPGFDPARCIKKTITITVQ